MYIYVNFRWLIVFFSFKTEKLSFSHGNKICGFGGFAIRSAQAVGTLINFTVTHYRVRRKSFWDKCPYCDTIYDQGVKFRIPAHYLKADNIEKYPEYDKDLQIRAAVKADRHIPIPPKPKEDQPYHKYKNLTETHMQRIHAKTDVKDRVIPYNYKNIKQWV